MLFLHNRTANDPGAFKIPQRLPLWQWFSSYVDRLHPSGRAHLAARILRGMLSQSYAPVTSASSATNLSLPIRLSPYLLCRAISEARAHLQRSVRVMFLHNITSNAQVLWKLDFWPYGDVLVPSWSGCTFLVNCCEKISRSGDNVSDLLDNVNIRLLPHYLFQVKHMGVTRKRDNYYRLYLCKKIKINFALSGFSL